MKFFRLHCFKWGICNALYAPVLSDRTKWLVDIRFYQKGNWLHIGEASLSSEIHNNGVSGLHSFSILQNIHILRNMLSAQVCTLKTEQYFECAFNVFLLYSHNWCKMYHTYDRCPKLTHSIEFIFIFCKSLISCFTSLALYASSVSSWRCIWNRMVNNYLHVNMIFIISI